MPSLATVPMLTREQVATRLGIDPDAVSSLIASKQLPAVNVAQKRNAKRPTWRVRPEDLEAFEAARSTAKPPATHRTTRK